MRSFRPLTLFAAGAWLLSAAPATAHRWYPAWCCNENDCRELDPDTGETKFATSYEDHLKNVEEYREWLRSHGESTDAADSAAETGGADG